MHFLTATWEAVSTATIANCFKEARLQLSTDDAQDLILKIFDDDDDWFIICLLYTSPSPRDRTRSRMPSSA